MGSRTMKAANGPLYRDLGGLDFRILMYLAQATYDDARDNTPARTYFGGIGAIVQHVYGIDSDAPEYKTRANAVNRAMCHLIDSGAIRRMAQGKGGVRAHYEICPLQTTIEAPDLTTPQGGQTLTDLTTPQGGSRPPHRVVPDHPTGWYLTTPQGGHKRGTIYEQTRNTSTNNLDSSPTTSRAPAPTREAM